MSTISGISPPTAEDPFRFGWRLVEVARPDGTIDYDRVPLSLEDLLHPRMGDVMPQSTPHDRDIHYLKDVFQSRVADDLSAVVYHDVIIDWDDPELRHHSPDISLIFGVHDPGAGRSSFHVDEEGVRPTLFIEVVSPDYRNNDVVTKVEQYHRARVPWYVIVDREDVDGPVRLLGYRYRPQRYEVLPLDNQGRLWLEPLRIWLGTGDNRVICYDGATGRELGDYARVTEELEAALEQADIDRKAREEAENAAAAAQRAAREAERTAVAAQRAAQEAERTAAAAQRETQEAEQTTAAARRETQEAKRRVAELEEALRRLQAGPAVPPEPDAK